MACAAVAVPAHSARASGALCNGQILQDCVYPLEQEALQDLDNVTQIVSNCLNETNATCRTAIETEKKELDTVTTTVISCAESNAGACGTVHNLVVEATSIALEDLDGCLNATTGTSYDDPLGCGADEREAKAVAAAGEKLILTCANGTQADCAIVWNEANTLWSDLVLCAGYAAGGNTGDPLGCGALAEKVLNTVTALEALAMQCANGQNATCNTVKNLVLQELQTIESALTSCVNGTNSTCNDALDTAQSVAAAVLAAITNSASVGLSVDPDSVLGQDNESLPAGVKVNLEPAALTPSIPYLTDTGVILSAYDDPGFGTTGTKTKAGAVQAIPADFQSGPARETGSACTPNVGPSTGQYSFHGTGCVQIFRLTSESDPTYNYYAHDFQATAQSEGGYQLWRVKWRDQSGTDSDGNYLYRELKNSPASDQPYGSCATASVGLTYLAATFGASWQVCSAKLHPWNSDTLFHSSWMSTKGNGENSGVTEATQGDSIWRTPNSDKYGYNIQDSMWVYTACKYSPCAE